MNAFLRKRTGLGGKKALIYFLRIEEERTEGNKLLDILCLMQNLTWLLGLCQLKSRREGQAPGPDPNCHQLKSRGYLFRRVRGSGGFLQLRFF